MCCKNNFKLCRSNIKKEVLVIKSKYETKVNEYEIKGNIAYIKLRKKDGTTIDAKIDADDLKAVLDKGTWFAEWDKDFNNYLVKTPSIATVDGKKIKKKQTLHSFLLDTNTKTPVRHINGDTLDNRRSNIKIYDQNAVINDYEVVDAESVYVILRDKYGRKNGKVLIDSEDLDRIINSFHSWVYYMNEGEHYAVANTKTGRIYLHKFIMNAPEDMVTKFVTHNTLDCRKSNLKNVPLIRESQETEQNK
jgi:hypothetical protein